MRKEKRLDYEKTVEENYVLGYTVINGRGAFPWRKGIYIMGKIDTITKEYMEDPVVFAD